MKAALAHAKKKKSYTAGCAMYSINAQAAHHFVPFFCEGIDLMIMRLVKRLLQYLLCPQVAMVPESLVRGFLFCFWFYEL